MKELEDFSNKIKKLEKVYKTLPSRMGRVAVNFSKERFRQQNWVDHTTQPWKKRKYEKPTDKGRAILVQSGRLKRSVRIVRKTSDYIVIGTDVPYAKRHNEGFRGAVSQSVKGTKIRAHKRRAHTRRGRKIDAVMVGNHYRKAHQRTLHQNTPRRQFMGNSALLNRNIDREVLLQINKAIR